LRERVKRRIAQTGGRVLPRELAYLGAEGQMLRVLRGLTRDAWLVRLGYTSRAAPLLAYDVTPDGIVSGDQ
jgi:hypothetical protein